MIDGTPGLAGALIVTPPVRPGGTTRLETVGTVAFDGAARAEADGGSAGVAGPAAVVTGGALRETTAARTMMPSPMNASTPTIPRATHGLIGGVLLRARGTYGAAARVDTDAAVRE